MTDNDTLGMDSTESDVSINHNFAFSREYLEQYATLTDWTDVSYNNFKNGYFSNHEKLSSVPKKRLIEQLVKISMPIITALRNDLSEKFISTFSSKRYTALELKSKKSLAAFAGDIYLITAFLVDIKKINIQTMGQVFNYTNINISNEHIEEKLDLILEENKSLKEIIVNLSDKIDALTKSLINKTPFTFATLAANLKTPLIDLTYNNNQLMPPPPGTPCSTKRKNTQETNSNSNKIQKVDTIKSSNTGFNKGNVSQKKTLKNFDSTKPGASSTSMNNNNWQKPKFDRKNEKFEAKKVQKSFAKSVGTGNFDGLGSVDRPHCIQIKRVATTCEPEKIQNFITQELKIAYSDFKEFELPHQHFKAYTLTISFLDKKIVHEKDKWPKGWVVKSFYQPKTQSNPTHSTKDAFNFGSNKTNIASNGSNKQPS